MSNYTIVGIDFGTSTSVVKVKNYYDGMKKNECHSVSIQGNTSVPTQVFKSEDGTLFFGKEVDSEIQAGTKGMVYRNFKMDLIHPDAEKRHIAREMTRAFFKFLYEQFNQQRQNLHVSPEMKTYVSFPAKWTPDVISFMKQCAIDAGFGDEYSVFGEAEPTAAIYAALTDNEEKIKKDGLIVQTKPINVLMLDMGAGTSDVTIFKFMADQNNKLFIGYEGQIITHPAIDNAYLCGGREVDELLRKYNQNYLEKVLVNSNVPEGLLRLNAEGVKEWKESSVSKRLKDDSNVPIPGYLNNSLNMLRQFNMLTEHPYPVIDRSVFELLTRTHWTQLRSLITDAIQKASKVIKGLKGPEDIDIAILTGGHSQWYCVKELLLGKSVAGLAPINFGKLKENPNRLLNESRPQETVACGLTYRDLEFDVTHTSPNGLWLRFILNDKVESEVYNPISVFDSLPCKKRIKWSHKIEANICSTKDAKLRCECLHGTNVNTAMSSDANTSVSLNSLGNFLWSLLFAPFGVFGATVEYEIMVDAIVSFDEDGSGIIDGHVYTTYNDSGDAFHIVL